MMIAKPEGRNYSGDPGFDGRIMLNWIFGKYDLNWNYFIQLWTGGGLLSTR
jgi:hypothetical protein